jgi:hypothetical protein
MKWVKSRSVSTALAVGLAAAAGSIGHAQHRENQVEGCSLGAVRPPCAQSLREQLVGTWTLVSCDEILGNAKSPYCVNPSGILMLDAGGRYALLIAAHGRPAGVRSASAAQAPAEVIRAVTQGLLANFGTWSVNEADRTFTRHVEGALFPSIEGLDLTASVTLDGDEVKFLGQQGSRLFRRVAAASAQPAP